MAVRRVFVIWTHPLFYESVRRMVMTHPEVEEVGATQDHAAALDQIKALQPDTVLIEEGASGDVLGEILEILEANLLDVRVIRLSLLDNLLKVYHRKLWTMAQTDDLIHLIQGD